MRYYWYLSLPFNCSIIKGQAYWKIRSATPLQTFFRPLNELTIRLARLRWPLLAQGLGLAAVHHGDGGILRHESNLIQSAVNCLKHHHLSRTPSTIMWLGSKTTNHQVGSKSSQKSKSVFTPGRWPCRPWDLDLFSPGSHRTSWEAIWDGFTITWPLDGCFLR